MPERLDRIEMSSTPCREVTEDDTDRDGKGEGNRHDRRIEGCYDRFSSPSLMRAAPRMGPTGPDWTMMA